MAKLAGSRARASAKGALDGIMAPKAGAQSAAAAVQTAEAAPAPVAAPGAPKKGGRQHTSTNVAFPDNVRAQIWDWLRNNPGHTQKSLLLLALKEFGFQVDDEDLKPGRAKYV